MCRVAVAHLTQGTHVQYDRVRRLFIRWRTLSPVCIGVTRPLLCAELLSPSGEVLDGMICAIFASGAEGCSVCALSEQGGRGVSQDLRHTQLKSL